MFFGPQDLLFYTFFTPNCLKVSILLEELALPYRVELTNMFRDDQLKPEFVQLNPNAKIPVLRNLADGMTPAGGLLGFARGQVATAAAVFDEVAVVAASDVLTGRRFGNLVLVAGSAPPLTEVARRVAGDPFPARVEAGETFARAAAVVTDATAAPSPRPPAGLFGQ